MEQEPKGVLVVSGVSQSEVDRLCEELPKCQTPDEYLVLIEDVMRVAREAGREANIEFHPLKPEE